MSGICHTWHIYLIKVYGELQDCKPKLYCLNALKSTFLEFHFMNLG